MAIGHRIVTRDLIMLENEIHLVAAFKGIKFIPPPFVFGHNNLNPKLILRENGIEFKSLLFTQHKPYASIDKVDVFINDIKVLGITTTNIIIVFKDSIFTFTGNLNNLEKLKELVILFDDKQCSLSEKAKTFKDS